MKKIIYIRLDGIIANFEKQNPNHQLFKTDMAERIPSIYDLVDPVNGGIEAVHTLLEMSAYELYFIATPHWDYPETWSEKRIWLEKLFDSKQVHKRLILCHQKQLLIGDYLIDDSWYNGAMRFMGEWIYLGADPKFSGWDEVVKYLVKEVE